MPVPRLDDTVAPLERGEIPARHNGRRVGRRIDGEDGPKRQRARVCAPLRRRAARTLVSADGGESAFAAWTATIWERVRRTSIEVRARCVARDAQQRASVWARVLSNLGRCWLVGTGVHPLRPSDLAAVVEGAQEGTPFVRRGGVSHGALGGSHVADGGGDEQHRPARVGVQGERRLASRSVAPKDLPP
eukprot:scaffold79522_cov29-Tisochrysis_lutea.AAC.3